MAARHDDDLFAGGGETGALMGGIDWAKGLYEQTRCMESWYFPTRSITAAKTTLSTNES